MKPDEDPRMYWLNRAGDALGRYAAHGGAVEIIDAEDDARLMALIVLPLEAAGPVAAAVERGRLMERVGVDMEAADGG